MSINIFGTGDNLLPDTREPSVEEPRDPKNSGSLYENNQLHEAIKQFITIPESGAETTKEACLRRVEEALEKCQDFTDVNGKTALHLWLQAPSLRLSNPCLKAITTKLCSRQSCQSRDEAGNTPLHVAGKHQAASIVSHVYRAYPAAACECNVAGQQPIDVMVRHRYEHRFWEGMAGLEQILVFWDNPDDALGSDTRKSPLAAALAERNWHAAKYLATYEWPTGCWFQPSPLSLLKRVRCRPPAASRRRGDSHSDARAATLEPGVISDYLTSMFPYEGPAGGSDLEDASEQAAFFAACRIGNWRITEGFFRIPKKWKWQHMTDEIERGYSKLVNSKGQTGLHAAFLNLQPKLVSLDLVELLLAPAASEKNEVCPVRENQLVLLAQLGFPLERILGIEDVASRDDWEHQDAEAANAWRLVCRFRSAPRTLRQLAVVVVRNSWACVREETVAAMDTLPIEVRQDIMLKGMRITGKAIGRVKHGGR